MRKSIISHSHPSPLADISLFINKQTNKQTNLKFKKKKPENWLSNNEGSRFVIFNQFQCAKQTSNIFFFSQEATQKLLSIEIKPFTFHFSRINVAIWFIRAKDLS